MRTQALGQGVRERLKVVSFHSVEDGEIEILREPVFPLLTRLERVHRHAGYHKAVGIDAHIEPVRTVDEYGLTLFIEQEGAYIPARNERVRFEEVRPVLGESQEFRPLRVRENGCLGGGEL